MKNKMERLVIHDTLTPFKKIVTLDDVYLWHCGALRNDDGTARFMGRTVSQSYLKHLFLILPSGIKISADKTNGRGWSFPGYADLINQKGDLLNLVPYTFDNCIDSFEITNGASGYNSNSRHCALIGGWSKNGRIRNGYKSPGILFEPEELYTPEALSTLKNYIIMQKTIVPTVIVNGHNELSKKPCPNFDVQKYLIKNDLN